MDQTLFAEETGNVDAFPSTLGTHMKVAAQNACSTMNALATKHACVTNVETRVPEPAVRTLVAMSLIIYRFALALKVIPETLSPIAETYLKVRPI